MENLIKKQLIMNSFPFPKEIQEHIKEFLFLDEKQSQILKNRKELVKSLKNELAYYIENDHWSLWTSTTQLQGVNCDNCGNFLFVIIPESSLCTCDF